MEKPQFGNSEALGILAAVLILLLAFGSVIAMAVAVLLDATLVRMVATPAILQLTGRANWWFPRWLDRIMPSLLAEIDSAGQGTS